MTFAHQVWSSSSRTNQTEAFDAFIAWKVNPRTDSENATNYSQSFLPTPTKFIQQTTFHLEFNVNLNNQASTLSPPLSQSRSTINSNLSEPERLFTTTSQQNSVISSNLLVFLQSPTYPDPSPDQFFVALLDFVRPKIQSCFGFHPHLRKYTTDENIGLLKNTRDLALVTESRRPMHKDHQAHVQYTTDYRNVYFHISLHCWRRIFPYLQFSAVEIYQPHAPLMLDHHKRFLQSLGIQI